MISKKEVEKQYRKLMQDVATSDYYKVDLSNRVNCYQCDCGHTTKTKDIDAGVIPFFFKCEKCGSSLAKSTFFKDVIPERKATFEWYRPTLEECLRLRNKSAMLDHVLKGGLVFRRVSENAL